MFLKMKKQKDYTIVYCILLILSIFIFVCYTYTTNTFNYHSKVSDINVITNGKHFNK